MSPSGYFATPESVRAAHPSSTRIGAWIALLRLEYQGDNFLTWFVATAVAVHHTGRFSAGWFSLGLVMLILSQAALELLDGYYDYVQGAHRAKDTGAQCWTGGSGVLAAGLVAAPQVRRVAWILGSAAVLLFLVISVLRTRMPGLLIGVIGALCGAGWAMPPLKLSYRGLGEFVLAIVAGPLLTAQAWLITTGTLEWRAFLIGVPFGLLELAMAMAHGVVDREDDAQVGKRTFVVRWGDRAAAWWYLGAVITAALVLAGSTATRTLPRPLTIALLMSPLGVASARALFRVTHDRRQVHRFARQFSPYWLHAGVGILCVLASFGSIAPAARTMLGITFFICYAPVAITLYNQRRQTARQPGFHDD